MLMNHMLINHKLMSGQATNEHSIKLQNSLSPINIKEKAIYL